MKRRRVLLRYTLAGLVLTPVLSAAAQNASSATYDVSTVKPHEAGDTGMSWGASDNSFRAINVTLKDAIAGAWDVRPDQVAGEPAWADDLRWDVTAKSSEMTPEQAKELTADRRAHMMQQLLAERFHVGAHLETRTGPVYTLLPAKGGVKLQPILRTAEQKAEGKLPGASISMRGGTTTVMEARNIPLAMLLRNFAGNLHRAVIDQSGLPSDAVYNTTLRWAPDRGVTASDSDALPLPAALEDQLGLHLESGKGPVQVLVVDHVDKPAPN